MPTRESYIPYAKQAYRVLRRMILEGQLKAGERLVERQLSERLGTSRTPIRAALQRLSSQGLVYLSPKGGARVSELTDKDIKEIYEVRAALESLAATKAASRISEKEVAKLEKLLEKARAAYRDGNYVRMAQINAAFYRTLYGFSGNMRLSRLLDTLCTTDTINREVILKNERMRSESISRTEEILEALKERKKRKVAALLVRYIERGKRILLETVKLEQ